MQTIYLDISNKGVIPKIHAKQGDVGRKFLVVVTDSGVPYTLENDPLISVWYEGASGEGNYSTIGEKSAFSVSGNKIIVEMVTQMLTNSGNGVLSLVITDKSGYQIGMWNIEYETEAVPGMDSPFADQYYTAFLDIATKAQDSANRAEAAAKKLVLDDTLSIAGQAADAKATGEKIEEIEESIAGMGLTATDDGTGVVTLQFSSEGGGGSGGGGGSAVSPTVEVEEIEGGHTVTITDVYGRHSFDVMDGEPGHDGYTPVKGEDYYTEADKQEMVGEVLAACCSHYSTLSGAIADINSGAKDNALADASSAKVLVGTADNGATTVTLLDDVTESVLIEVKKDIDLVLNGYTLNFDAQDARLSYLAGTNCTISGEVEGSAITKTCDATSTVYLINLNGDSICINGGTYNLTGNVKTAAMITHGSGLCEINKASLYLESSSSVANSKAYCLQVRAKMHIKDTIVSVRGTASAAAIYQAPGSDVIVESSNVKAVTLPDESVTNGMARCAYVAAGSKLSTIDSTMLSDGPGDDAGETMTTGISNYGTLFCKNTNVTGTQCGVNNAGALYVSGGTFTGYSHGGFYLSDCTTEGLEGAAYINDATIRCGNYTGEFTDIFAGDTVEILGGMYIGSGSNITAYLDGCSINDDNAGEFGLIVRASGGETNNHLNISNSTIGGYCRVDSDAVELNLGHGVTLLKGAAHPDATYASYITYTNEVYRKHHPDEQLNGNDYGALVKTVKAEPKMELIHSATIPEEGLAYIDLTTYKLDAVTLTINSPATATRGTARLQVYYNGSLFYRGGDVAASDNQNRAHSQTQDIWKVNGAWRYESAYQVTGWGIAKYTDIHGKVMLESDYPYIDRVIVYFASMPVGADIKIYGVKRHEN